MSLLVLATLLVYAVPGHASLTPHRHSPVPHDHSLTGHALTGAHDHSVAAAAGHGHEQLPCDDGALADNDACCSVAHCVTMHGGLPAVSFEPFVPHSDRTNRLLALAMPEGIGTDPALRPPL